jgi:hypothetical protein
MGPYLVMFITNLLVLITFLCESDIVDVPAGRILIIFMGE